MTTVLGLDLSATKAGVALPTGRLLTLTAPDIDAAKHGSGEIGRRLHWWHEWLRTLLAEHRPDVVALEGPLLHVGGIGTIRTLEVHGVARLVTRIQGAELDEISPAELKKWATGNGAASKADMIAAAVARGADPKNDDEADAFLLRAWSLEVRGGG